MEAFRLTLTPDEKQTLKELARLAIASRLTGRGPAAAPAPATETLRRPLGAFVTLKRDGALRGCIGNLVGAGPLYETVWGMAQAAAFQDPRFNPLTPPELDGLEIEISIMGPLEPCPDPQLVEIGRHGLIMRRGARQGLLLPQVPVEWGWDREQFLAQTCRKAGLPANAWREPDTEIIWFEASVF
ncbi:MAG: AmmeMemoRadiSam system protein A [Proteobacteria bacterium]|nr:AmmeMemoRadiSam system protein A [Pseudomonadota bacterium]MBU1595840.1 AmmeMemoRadiSam system protein A [Pseudomonadota bacterium]